MSRRYWYAVIAAGLVACLFASSVESKVKHRHPHHQSHATAQGGQAPAVPAQANTAQASEDSSDQPKAGKNSKFDLDVRSVEAAERAARWTKYGVYVGAAGIIFVIATLAISIWQSAIARRAYAAEHRPRIRLLGALVDDILPPEAPIPCKIAIINIGGSNATDIRADLAFIGGRPNYVKVIGRDNFPLCKLMAASESDVLDWNTSFQLSIEDALEINKGIGTLCLNGSIFYKDTNGVVRRTGVFRVYNPTACRFEKAPPSHKDVDQDFEA